MTNWSEFVQMCPLLSNFVGQEGGLAKKWRGDANFDACQRMLRKLGDDRQLRDNKPDRSIFLKPRTIDHWPNFDSPSYNSLVDDLGLFESTNY